MGDTPRGERLQIMLTPEELEALDTWRFTRRMPSRAAAVRELLKRGLADISASPEGRSRSQDYGVIGALDGIATGDADDSDGHAHESDGDGRGDGFDGHGR